MRDHDVLSRSTNINTQSIQLTPLAPSGARHFFVGEALTITNSQQNNLYESEIGTVRLLPDWDHDLGPQSAQRRGSETDGSAIGLREVSHDCEPEAAACMILR